MAALEKVYANQEEIEPSHRWTDHIQSFLLRNFGPDLRREDLRRLLIQQQQQPPPKKKNKGAQRKRALKRGKEKIKTAKQKALAAETKTSGDTPAKKASIPS